MILLVLLAVGPLFKTLPECVLAAIVVVALKGLLVQVKDFKKLLGVSIIEAVRLQLLTFSCSNSFPQVLANKSDRFVNAVEKLDFWNEF